MAWFIVGVLTGLAIGVPVGFCLMSYGVKLIKEREPERLHRWIDR